MLAPGAGGNGRAVEKPSLVFHADWSTNARKRWGARAVLEAGGYRVPATEPVGEAETLLARLLAAAGGGPVVAGFDFPIGVPARWAASVGVESFPRLLEELAVGGWPDFYRVAREPSEISLGRPFYPATSGKKGEKLPSHLLTALGVDSMEELLRRCERARPGRRAACALFWTLGGNQVGKAAIAGWRDVLVPALSAGLELALWPFDGELAELVRPGRVVVVETYPAEACAQLGIRMTKSSRDDRGRAAPALARGAAALGVALAPPFADELRRGFDDDDRFDAAVGLLGMLDVLLGSRGSGEPRDDAVRRVEGWILGQRAGERASRG